MALGRTESVNVLEGARIRKFLIIWFFRLNLLEFILSLFFNYLTKKNIFVFLTSSFILNKGNISI
jgi:hypothetical protein